MDYLRGQGWHTALHQVVHKSTEVAVYDAVEALRFRTYFQCLCILPRVLPLTNEFPSRQVVPYYKLLLRGLQAQPYGQAKTYQLVLNKDLKTRGQAIEIPELEDVVPAPVPPNPYGIIAAGAEMLALPAAPKRKAGPGPRGARRGGAAAKRGAGGPERDPPVIVDPPLPLPPPGGTGGGSGDPPPPIDEGHPAVVGIIAGPPLPPPTTGRRRDLGRVWHDALFENTKVQYTAYTAPHTTIVYKNYIIKGPDSVGVVRSKTRGRTAEYTARHGDIEPLAFLHAWLLRDHSDRETRRRGNDPTNAEVDAIVERHGDALRELFHLCVPVDS